MAVEAAATMASGTLASEALSALALIGFAALPPRPVVPVASAKNTVPSAGCSGFRVSGQQLAHWLWLSALLSACTHLHALNLAKGHAHTSTRSLASCSLDPAPLDEEKLLL